MNELSPLTQVPPFLQGESSHGSTTAVKYMIFLQSKSIVNHCLYAVLYGNQHFEVTSVLKGHWEQKNKYLIYQSI